MIREIILGILLVIGALAGVSAIEKQTYLEATPGDWVSINQIELGNEKVTIIEPDLVLAIVEDTGSMRPVMDSASNLLMKKPADAETIKTGDIIVFYAARVEKNVVHRVVDIQEDKKGLYYVTKGDSSANADPERTRFRDIMYVVVGILY